MDFVSTISSFFGALTIIGQIIFFIVIFGLLYGLKTSRITLPVKIFGEHATLIGFGIAAFSVIASLYYSEIVNYPPCELCWWQRIFLFPQAIIFLIALIRREKIFIYPLALSVIGSLFAIYNYFLQFGGPPLQPCDITVAASCADRLIFEFGYITIPMMCLTAFALIIVTMLAGRYMSKRGNMQ